MPTVSTSVEIPDVTVEHVWQIVSDFENYAEYMDDVVEIRFVERGGDHGRSAWRVLLNGSELTWEEKDRFTAPNRIDFEQLDGDLEDFRGSWVLEESENGVTVTLEISFDLGIPSLSAVLDPIGVQAIRSNSTSMLAAISKQRVTVAS